MSPDGKVMTDFASMSMLNWRALPFGQQVGVFRGFFARHERLVADLEASQPFDVRVAFIAGQQQPQRIALLRPDRFAVLAISKDRVLEHFFHRNAARHHRRIGAFREHPAAAVLEADFAGDGRKLNARPFRCAEQTVRALHGLQRRLVPFRQAVAGTFDEMFARHRRKSLDVRHRELARPVDHAVHDKACVWPDRWSGYRRDGVRNAALRR